MKFDLTEREQEIYKLLATTDLTYKEIAKMLILSEKTVMTHKRNIYDKLNFKNRAALTRHYYEGLINGSTDNGIQ